MLREIMGKSMQMTTGNKRFLLINHYFQMASGLVTKALARQNPCQQRVHRTAGRERVWRE
jgi:hypothetical protein